MKSDRTQDNRTVPALENGQVWTLKDKCLEIKRVGKYLVEFLITPNEAKADVSKHMRAAKRLESIETVRKFLEAHKAVLHAS